MNDTKSTASLPRGQDIGGPIGRVYLVTPGGLTAKGGIGRMVEYIHRTWAVDEAPLVIVDSYGPGSKAWMPVFYARCLLRILRDALSGKIGLLHIHMSERLSVLRKGLIVHLAKAFRIPVVLHLHGADFADYCHSLSPGKFAAVQNMMRKADAIVTLGNYWRDFVHNDLGVPAERITVLHNAVPGPERVPTKNAGPDCRFLFLGVVCERKGVPTLLNALADNRLAMDRNWTIDFAGNGEVERYHAEALKLGLGERVRFHGWVDEKAARSLLEKTDVLVLPSRNEGLPMAILEAMAYGLPIVSTPVGSIADAVEDGDNGFLVPVGDSTRLAGALANLASDGMLRQRMGQRSRQRYLDMFDIVAFNRKLEKIFMRAKQHLPVDRLDADSQQAPMSQLGKASLGAGK